MRLSRVEVRIQELLHRIGACYPDEMTKRRLKIGPFLVDVDTVPDEYLYDLYKLDAEYMWEKYGELSLDELASIAGESINPKKYRQKTLFGEEVERYEEPVRRKSRKRREVSHGRVRSLEEFMRGEGVNEPVREESVEGKAVIPPEERYEERRDLQEREIKIDKLIGVKFPELNAHISDVKPRESNDWLSGVYVTVSVCDDLGEVGSIYIDILFSDIPTKEEVRDAIVREYENWLGELRDSYLTEGLSGTEEMQLECISKVLGIENPIEEWEREKYGEVEKEPEIKKDLYLLRKGKRIERILDYEDQGDYIAVKEEDGRWRKYPKMGGFSVEGVEEDEIGRIEREDVWEDVVSSQFDSENLLEGWEEEEREREEEKHSPTPDYLNVLKSIEGLPKNKDLSVQLSPYGRVWMTTSEIEERLLNGSLDPKDIISIDESNFQSKKRYYSKYDEVKEKEEVPTEEELRQRDKEFLELEWDVWHTPLEDYIKRMKKEHWSPWKKGSKYDRYDSYYDREFHRRVVERALKYGMTVPPEVLKDYPDLVEKYRKKEEEPEETLRPEKHYGGGNR